LQEFQEIESGVLSLKRHKGNTSIKTDPVSCRIDSQFLVYTVLLSSLVSSGNKSEAHEATESGPPPPKSNTVQIGFDFEVPSVGIEVELRPRDDSFNKVGNLVEILLQCSSMERSSKEWIAFEREVLDGES